MLSSGYFWPMQAYTYARDQNVLTYRYNFPDGVSAAATLIRQLDGWQHSATKVCCH